ncbi:MAG: DegV family protein [Candidatus Izemoplasmatales bacterium]|nr:DegV family protein [Candidatus Izemoplasmatales bacterium]MDD4988000.1 DegV family protein [Candidatus Izemoplasmatales bacterium]
MEFVTFEGNDLYHAFLSGARKLISIKHHLNNINVFPVPDGDTGSNMSYLMQTIINEARPSEDFSETMDSIATAALSGSRGNSGIIISEYFNGLSEKLKGKTHVKLDEFMDAVKHAIKKAYEAIMNPVEGTILTILRKAAEVTTPQTSFNSYFKTSLEQAKQALKETTEQLEVLKKNGVVDAGAEGFTAFLEGINYYLETGKTETPNLAPVVEAIVVSHDMVVTERYCTEALLIHVNRSSHDLQSLLAEMGSSLIVSGHSDKMRIHIHTDFPEKFFLKLREYGQIVEQKVDDMIRQQQAISASHPRIAIVTDTIADLPLEIMDEYQIHRLPMSLMVDDTSYIDRFSITTDTFYDLMPQTKKFSSSQPDPKTIERTLEFLLDHYDDIIVVTVASKLSGTYNAILHMAQDEKRIHLVDSRQNSGAQGLVVLEAAKQIASGASLESVLKALESVIARTRIYVSVKTLKYMVRQGRVSKVTGLLAKLMNLKPVISLDAEGGGIIREKAFSLHQNEKKILKLIKKAPVDQFGMVHALAPKRAQKLAERITEITGKKPLFTTTISPIVAMNAGIGAIGVALTFKTEVK